MSKEKIQPKLKDEKVVIQKSFPNFQTDAEVNPFLTEEERKLILEEKIQDPEWD